MTTPARDPERCPLCEQPNDCGAARGEATCWCFSAEIPPAVIARVQPIIESGLAMVWANKETAQQAIAKIVPLVNSALAAG